MILLSVREFFNELLFCSLLILPLFILWFIVYVILKVKKYDKSTFCYRCHKNTEIILLIALLTPVIGSLISNFCPGEQKTFQSYDYFIGTEPALTCDFADELPEDNIHIRYYCHHEPLQIGKVVGVNYIFEQENAPQDFMEERVLIWDKTYSEREYIIYRFDEDGLPLTQVDEEKLRKYLAKLSDFSLEEYKVLLYFEDNYGRDQRWILYNEDQREVIEIVSDYANW